MAAIGYTDAATVNAYLGGVLSATQLTQATALVPAVEEWIDARTQRRYKRTITDEVYWLEGPDLFLRSTPVASVEALKLWQSGALSALVAASDYEVRDLATGWVLVFRGSAPDVITYTPGDTWPPIQQVWASYTSIQTVPERVKLAATMIVAAWLSPTMNPDLAAMGDIKSYSVGQDLSVTFRDAQGDSAEAGIPPEALRLLAGLRRVVFA